VMVVGADNRAQYREVKLGAHVGGLRIVNEGLKADERIVVGGLQRIRPGTLVDPKPVDMKATVELQARAGSGPRS
jgi:multidrug efflux system membrane fusion protein